LRPFSGKVNVVPRRHGSTERAGSADSIIRTRATAILRLAVRTADLTPELRNNTDHVDAPFDLGTGEPPRLRDRDVAEIVAVLRTLTDADVLPSASARFSAS
jgi:hypothetical protein